jgi:hypothetical protein
MKSHLVLGAYFIFVGLICLMILSCEQHLIICRLINLALEKVFDLDLTLKKGQCNLGVSEPQQNSKDQNK